MYRILVCGAGTMGSGIAQVAATAGFTTLLYELNPQVLEGAKERLRRSLEGLVEKGRLTAEKKDAIWQRLQFTSDLDECQADIVIEAIIEKREAKVELFNRLAAINGERTVFASNTSSLSITSIAEGLTHPERVAGLHFFNPAPLMKLVEVVRGRHTSDEVADLLTELTRSFGKEPVHCTDSPGFIVNRVARPYYIEALRQAEAGLASFETIDRLLEARGFRMGPFKLMDLIGNDVNYAVSCSVYEQLGRPERLKPSPIQEEKVARGELGKKTGQGYYRY
jgi:3-hydroxybutyryl-CoA dehydrogenase